MKDPICGMEVAKPPKIRAERGGVVYGFCSEGCRKTFEAGGGSQPMAERTPLKGYFILSAALAAITVFGLWRGTMADFMGAFFVVFGAFKLLDLGSFADAYAAYDLLAAKVRAYGLVYPFLQLALGAAYLTRFELRWTSTVALGVMTLSSLGVAKALLQKRKIKCACLGTKIQLPMSTISLVEDLTMAVMAALMLR